MLLERRPWETAAMKKNCVTQNVIILLSITTEHQTSTAGLLQLLPKIHLSRKHNKHKTNIKAVTDDVCVWKYVYRVSQTHSRNKKQECVFDGTTCGGAAPE